MFRRLERSVLLQFETSRVFYKCSVAFYDGKSTMFFRVVPSKTRSTFQLVAKFFFFLFFLFFLSFFFFSRTLTVNSLQKYIEGWKEEEEKERESRNSGELYLLYLIKNRESVWYGKVYFSLISQCVYTLFLPFFSKRKLCFTIVFLINSFPQRFPVHVQMLPFLKR